MAALRLPSIVALALLASAALARPAGAGTPGQQQVRRPSGRVAIVHAKGVNIVPGTLGDVVANRKAVLARHVDGLVGSGHGAAFQELIVEIPDGAEIKVKPGAYSTSPHVDVSPVVSLRGFDGDVEAVHLGTISVHHLKGDPASNAARYEEIQRDDRMAIAIDGNRVVNHSPSGKVGEHRIVIPRGAAKIEYIRQLLNGSERNANGYSMGRLFNLLWG